jgi:hypothetical protein
VHLLVIRISVWQHIIIQLSDHNSPMDKLHDKRNWHIPCLVSIKQQQYYLFLFYPFAFFFIFLLVQIIYFVLSISSHFIHFFCLPVCVFYFLYSLFYSFPFYPLYLYLQNLSTFHSPVSNTNTWHIPTPQTGPYNTWLLLSPRCIHNPTCLLVGEGYVQS